MAGISEIEGVGEGFAAKLKAAGVDTTSELLEQAGSAAKREALAATTGISEKLILKWVNHADLMRLDGVGPQTAELLEAAGVDSVAELAQRNAANLAQKLDEVNAQKNLVNRVPNEPAIAAWIAEAQSLPRKVSH